MALFEDLSVGSVVSTTLLGLGIVVAAPLLLPVVGAVARPVARLAIQGGIAAYDAAPALVTTTGEALTEIVAEARAAAAAAAPAPDAAPVSSEVAPHILRPEGTVE